MSPAAAQLQALRERVVAEPRAVLEARDRVNLLQFAIYPAAMKVGRAWMLGGRRYTAAALDRLTVLGLTAEIYRRPRADGRGGGIFLQLTPAGHAALAALGRPPKPPAEPARPIPPSRAYWLD